MTDSPLKFAKDYFSGRDAAVLDALRRSSVGIAGAGGLGSTVAVALARAGVGRLVIADFDRVEPSNLNRQQYFVDQIGWPKVEALRATLARANPCVEVVAHAVRLDPGNIPVIFDGVDVVVEAFDRAEEKLMLVETLARALPQMPVVMGSGVAGWGATELLRVHRAGNVRACGDERAEAGPGMGLMAPRVGVVACMEANEVMEILLGPDPGLAQARP
jgi:sulfur carrier protein ThiS adenylyltransferase